LGQMNLHGYFGKERMHYGDEESIDFTNMYFYTILYHAIKASNQMAKDTGSPFDGFENSKYASGEFFDKYTSTDGSLLPKKVAKLFKDAGVDLARSGRLGKAKEVCNEAWSVQSKPSGCTANGIN
jgi:ribonucleoside-diphosphate reductase alpha chain